MSKVIKLTETDFVRLVKKIINEREIDVFEEYISNLQFIYNEFNEDITEGELQSLIDEIEYVIQSAQEDDELNEDELDELIRIAKDMVYDMEEMFYDE